MDKKAINPISFLKECVICKDKKKENELKIITEDDEYEEMYICIDCLNKSNIYMECERHNCDNVYNTNINTGKYDNYCTNCNEAEEMGDYNDEELGNLVDYD
ncbi:hypothetical protein AAK964_12255 [Tissierella praeacuta]|uniref:hypothetical protein n=1 Tax=Tissierella praeacuta TaxID=43131 RepID=UPI003512C7CD